MPEKQPAEVSTEASFDGKAFARSLNNKPGIYSMLDRQGIPLYIGKAAQLRKRVSSYFNARPKNSRISRMLAQVKSIDIAITRTEAEALLLENQRIKVHQPRYNVLLKDDKSYPFVFLSSADDFPRVAFHRGGKAVKGRYFGPFPSTTSVRESINLIQRIFRIRNCEDSVFSHRSRPCLQYQIKRCSAPCVDLVSKSDYRADVNDAINFLEGRNEKVLQRLAKRMQALAGQQKFEEAAHYRDQIANLRTLQAKQYIDTAEDTDCIAYAAKGGLTVIQLMSIRGGRNIGSRTYYPSGAAGVSPARVMAAFLGQYFANKPAPPILLLSVAADDQALFAQTLSVAAGKKVQIITRPRTGRAKLLGMTVSSARNALVMKQLSKASIENQFAKLAQLLQFEVVPQRLECFDISHISGTNTVGSCVVFDRSGALTGQYRRFNLKNISPGDDYAAMRQVLSRRYTRVVKEDAVLPDMVIVDGGRGQLKQVQEVMIELGLASIPILAIAKGQGRRVGHEEWLPGWQLSPLRPPADSVAGHLLQQIRDEAHRFAIAGHRAKRKQTIQRSQLEKVSGIGVKRRRALLEFFGGLQGVKSASVEELQRAEGISRKLAEQIYAAFR